MFGMADGAKETKEDVVGMRHEREVERVACSEGHQNPYLVLYQANLLPEMLSPKNIMLTNR